MLAATRQTRHQVQAAGALDAVVGLWLLISVWVLGTEVPLAWSSGLCGLAVVALAGVRVAGAFRAAAMSWTNAVIGAWVAVSPWLLAGGGAESGWNAFWCGLAIACVAGWSALVSNADQDAGEAEQPA